MQDAITLAVMVRDDARRLDRCLASLEGFVDEVLVLDTGSVDDSVEVARKHGARVEQIEWPNDFSAALNILLGHIQTPWTLRLDSDEWFDPSQAKILRSYAESQPVCGYYLVRRDLLPSGTFDEIHVLRMWRTHEQVRYEGVVHEVIRHARFDSAWPGKRLLRSDSYFWHDGYVEDIRPKAVRNLELLRLEVERRPESLDAQAMLATTLRGMGDPEGQERLQDLVDHLLNHPPSFVPVQVALALGMYMDSLSVQAAQDPRTEDLIVRAVEWFPKNPVVLYFAAVLERKREEMEASLSIFLTLEALVDADDYDRGISIPSELVGERLWRSMAFVASKIGREDVVQRCNRRLSMQRAPKA